MQGTIQSYVLYMADDVKKEPLKVKQCDTNSRWAKITLKAFEGEYWLIPFDVQIYLNVHKADGTLATATCTKIDEHTVLAPITEQMTAVTGTQSGELYFLAPDGDIKSQTFPIAVYPMVMDQARIESSDDFQSLQDALRDVKTSTEAADNAAQYATEQGNSARDGAQRANDAADSIQVAVDAAAAAKASETNAKTSETAVAQTQQEVTDYVEAQKAAFVGYSQRESDSKYANALTETATGEGGVTVEDAWTAPVLGLNVAGKSEQVVTTGAQLLDFEQCLKEWNSKYTCSDGRVYTVNALGAGFQNPISFSYEDIKVTLSGKVRDISGSRYRIELMDSSGNSVGRIDKDTKSITVMASKIRLNFTEGGAGEYADIMINAGDIPLPWEPYMGCQNAAITLTEPLRGIEEYRDRIMCRDGVWGIERCVGVVDNGQWKKINVVSGSAGHRFVYDATDMIEKLNCMVMCTKYTRRPNGSSFSNAGDYMATDERGKIFIRTLNPDFETIEAFKEFMADAITIYPLATPTWEPFPDATQQALNALTTYAGTTHLTITAGGPAPTVTLNYVKDTHKALEQCQEAAKEYTDNQIAAIVAALPTATQAAIVDNQTTRLLQEV